MNLDEAIRRLKAREPQWKFDARDREALAVVLEALETANDSRRQALLDASRACEEYGDSVVKGEFEVHGISYDAKPSVIMGWASYDCARRIRGLK